MESVAVREASRGDLTPWERIGTQTRYGRYATKVERGVIEEALAHTRPSGIALDVGSEGVRWSELAAAAGWQVICTDVSQSSLDACQARVPSARCIHVGPEDARLPVEDGSVGLLLCVEVAPVIHRDWFIGEAARVLRSGGQLIGVCWNRRSWRGLLYHKTPLVRIRNASYWYGYPLSYPEWRAELGRAGFSMQRQVGYAWLPFRRSSDSPLVPFAAFVEGALGVRRLPSLSPMIAFSARKL